MLSTTGNRKELMTVLFRATFNGLERKSLPSVLALISLQMDLKCNMLQLHLCAGFAL